MELVEKSGKLYTERGSELGDVYREVDGYLVFVPKAVSGFYNEYSLRLIADFLENANKEHDTRVKKFLNSVQQYEVFTEHEQEF